MAYYLLVRYNVNGGKIVDNPHYYSGGVTSYSSVTASSSSSYKYFKATSTTANVTGSTSSSGTYGTVGNRYTSSSASTVVNLIDISTFGISRDGYHTEANTAYRTTSTGGNVIGQNGTSAPSANQATISRLGGSTSANKTVTIYVNWIPNTYTVHYNANGGSGTMADGNASYTTWNYGTSYALRSNAFTKTGYTFAGWATSSGDSTEVFYVMDEGPYDPDVMGTDGNYLYLRQGSTYYRITVDGSDSYTSLGTTAPSGVSTWVSAGQNNIVILNGNSYYWSHTYSESSGIDRTRVYRKEVANVVYTNGQSVSNLTTTDGGEVTLYAVWTPNTYSLSYSLYNEAGVWPSGAVHPTTATYDQAFTVTNPIDNYNWYEFFGWYITGMDSTTHTIGTSTSTSTTANKVLATNFKNLRATSGTVKFNGVWWGRTFGFTSGLAGATYSVTQSEYISPDDSETGEEAEEITLPTGAAISGWTFAGWRKDTTAASPHYYSGLYDVVGISNTELYAVYTRTLTLSFANGGGSGTGPTSLTATQYYNSTGNVSTVTFTLPSNTFTAPSGYSFADWGSSSTGAGASYTWTPAVSASTTQTLTARWKRTIYFRSGTGQGASGSYDQYYGSTTIVTPAVTTISGWNTLGWRDDSTASTSEYAASSTVSYSGSATTFYAVYSRTLTQSYDANGGSGTAPAAKTATQYYNTYGNVSTATFAAQANTFTAPTDTNGWSFFIWSTSTSPTSGTTYSETASPTWAPSASSTTTSRTLYVRWHRILHFYSGISEAQLNTVGQYRGGSTYTTVTFPTPATVSTSGTPWSALGWRTNTTAATNQYSSGSQSYTGTSVDFYGIYERIVQINFSANGGTGTEPDPIGGWQYYNSYGNLSNVYLTLPANTFTRLGYTFTGWDMGSPSLNIVVSPALDDYSFLNSNAMWIPRVYIKQNGTWKESVPQIKVSGTWKTPIAMYVKVNDTWKQIY